MRLLPAAGIRGRASPEASRRTSSARDDAASGAPRHGRPMRRRAAVLAVALTGVLTSCSSEGEPGGAATATPEVCASAEQFEASLNGLGDVQVLENGTAALEEAWTAVQIGRAHV